MLFLHINHSKWFINRKNLWSRLGRPPQFREIRRDLSSDGFCWEILVEHIGKPMENPWF